MCRRSRWRARYDPSGCAGSRRRGLARRGPPDQAQSLRRAEIGRDRERPDWPEALQEHCRQSLAPYKYPRWIEFRPDLPKTATGKIQRFKLRAEAPGIAPVGEG